MRLEFAFKVDWRLTARIGASSPSSQKAGREKIPDYAFDCHTQKGRKMGKSNAEFFRDEQVAAIPVFNGHGHRKRPAALSRCRNSPGRSTGIP